MQLAPRVIRTTLLLACAALLAGCGSDDGGDSSDTATTESSSGATVTMESNEFDPETTTVTVGDSVTFENEDGYAHNVKSTSGEPKIDIDDFESGTRSVTLDEAGTVDYECTIHDGMTGSITVEEA